MPANHLPRELTLRDAFWFPLSTPQARRDIITGGLLVLLLLPLGWILNLGNRLNVVERIYRNEQPVFRGFAPWTATLKRGCLSFAAITLYLSPALSFGAAAVFLKFHGQEFWHWFPAVLSAMAFILAVFTLPGGMTVFACENDLTVLKSPHRAFLRAWSKRRVYGYAWFISLAAVALSGLGILALGIGLVFSCVWSWEVVGYAFTVAMYSGAE
jgi:hypothetical protein